MCLNRRNAIGIVASLALQTGCERWVELPCTIQQRQIALMALDLLGDKETGLMDEATADTEASFPNTALKSNDLMENALTVTVQCGYAVNDRSEPGFAAAAHAYYDGVEDSIMLNVKNGPAIFRDEYAVEIDFGETLSYLDLDQNARAKFIQECREGYFDPYEVAERVDDLAGLLNDAVQMVNHELGHITKEASHDHRTLKELEKLESEGKDPNDPNYAWRLDDIYTLGAYTPRVEAALQDHYGLDSLVKDCRSAAANHL